MGFECPVSFIYWCTVLFDNFRYSDEQIPGVLYASVNPEYMTSTDGITYLKRADINFYLFNVIDFGCLFLFFLFCCRSKGDDGPDI